MVCSFAPHGALRLSHFIMDNFFFVCLGQTMSLTFKGWWEDLTKFGVVNLQYFVWILICWRLWELWRLGGSWWRNNWRGEGWWWCQGANWQWVTGVGPKLQLFLWCKISADGSTEGCVEHMHKVAWILHSRFWVPYRPMWHALLPWPQGQSIFMEWSLAWSEVSGLSLSVSDSAFSEK